MRYGQRASGLRAAKLIDDNGFFGRKGSARHDGERFGIAYGFEKHQDRAGFRIVDQHIADFTDSEVGFIADGDQLGKPHAAFLPA